MMDRQGKGQDGRVQVAWLVFVLVLEAALVDADATRGPLASAFVVAPLVMALVAPPVLTAAAGTIAVALAALSGLWEDQMAAAGYPVRLGVVAAGSTLAYALARRRRMREAAERDEVTHWRLLADTADLLASSLDYESRLRGVAQLAVPALADWCAIELPGPHGRLEPVAVAHPDSEKAALGRELRRRFPADEHDALAQVARSGTSFIRRDIGDEDLIGYAREDEHLRLLRRVGFRSVMIVPLMAGRRTIGAMTFVAAESGRHFDHDDLELAQELGRRAGSALENARLYRERTELAQTLVGALRPPAMPPMPGWKTATLYRPAGRAEEVGGDFYDVISIADGWMLVIGDVIGKGPSAAARTSLARYSIRTAATLTGSPGGALRQLNDDLLRDGLGALITAACVMLREDEHGAVATIAVAGHPLPLLVRGGEPEQVGRPSLLLGVARDAAIVEETVRIRDGESLVLYTDGVTDTKGRDGRFGFERLVDALRGASGSPEAILRRVSDPLERFQHGADRDDIAMLVVCRTGEEATAHDAGGMQPSARFARRG